MSDILTLLEYVGYELCLSDIRKCVKMSDIVGFIGCVGYAVYLSDIHLQFDLRFKGAEHR